MRKGTLAPRVISLWRLYELWFVVCQPLLWALGTSSLHILLSDIQVNGRGLMAENIFIYVYIYVYIYIYICLFTYFYIYILLFGNILFGLGYNTILFSISAFPHVIISQ